MSKIDLDFLQLPSPWQELRTSWSKQAEVHLFIKRDDLIHPLISGNKWRKLSAYVLSHPSLRAIHTYGGAYSNHLIATASLANKLNLESVGFVRGIRPKRLSTVLELCLDLGMQLEFLDYSSYDRNKESIDFKNETLSIPEGGKGPMGMRGCEAILSEIPQSIDHCIIACGTGTTLAGLVKASKGLTKPKMIGVPVLKGGEYLRADIEKWAESSNFELWTDFHYGGYAKTTNELYDFIQEFLEETNILLDPIYTAKAFLACKKHALSSGFKPGERVGLVHTGGLTGWYGKWAHWAKKRPEPSGTGLF